FRARKIHQTSAAIAETKNDPTIARRQQNRSTRSCSGSAPPAQYRPYAVSTPHNATVAPSDTTVFTSATTPYSPGDTRAVRIGAKKRKNKGAMPPATVIQPTPATTRRARPPL